VSVSLKHEICEKAFARGRGVLRIDLDPDAGKDRRFITKKSFVIFPHVTCFGDPPSCVVRARADYDGFDTHKRRS